MKKIKGGWEGRQETAGGDQKVEEGPLGESGEKTGVGGLGG